MHFKQSPSSLFLSKQQAIRSTSNRNSTSGPMDRTSFLVWNVRGLNDKARRDNLRKLVDDSKPTVVCLQETKLPLITERDVASFLGQQYTNFVFLPAQQTRGGILVAWREETFAVTHHHIHRHSISVLLSNQYDPPWWFTGSMALTKMLINLLSLMSSERYGPSVLALGC